MQLVACSPPAEHSVIMGSYIACLHNWAARHLSRRHHSGIGAQPADGLPASAIAAPLTCKPPGWVLTPYGWAGWYYETDTDIKAVKCRRLQTTLSLITRRQIARFD